MPRFHRSLKSLLLPFAEGHPLRRQEVRRCTGHRDTLLLCRCVCGFVCGFGCNDTPPRVRSPWRTSRRFEKTSDGSKTLLLSRLSASAVCMRFAFCSLRPVPVPCTANTFLLSLLRFNSFFFLRVSGASPCVPPALSACVSAYSFPTRTRAFAPRLPLRAAVSPWEGIALPVVLSPTASVGIRVCFFISGLFLCPFLCSGFLCGVHLAEEAHAGPHHAESTRFIHFTIVLPLWVSGRRCVRTVGLSGRLSHLLVGYVSRCVVRKIVAKYL